MENTDTATSNKFTWHVPASTHGFGTKSEVVLGRLAGKFPMRNVVYDDQNFMYQFMVVSNKVMYLYLGSLIRIHKSA